MTARHHGEHAVPLVTRRYAEQYPTNRIRIIESGAFDVSCAVLGRHL